MNIPLTREAWLLAAIELLRPLFLEKGYNLPRVRVSCGIPATSRRGSAVGQCWPIVARASRQDRGRAQRPSGPLSARGDAGPAGYECCASPRPQGGLPSVRVSGEHAYEAPGSRSAHLSQRQGGDGPQGAVGGGSVLALQHPAQLNSPPLIVAFRLLTLKCMN